MHEICEWKCLDKRTFQLNFFRSGSEEYVCGEYQRRWIKFQP